MSYGEIEQAVIEIIASKLNADAIRVRPETRLIEDLGADSMNSVEIPWEIADKFLIYIGDSDIQGARTVRDIVRLVADALHVEQPSTVEA
jgi:acyl carrier protein